MTFLPDIGAYLAAANLVTETLVVGTNLHYQTTPDDPATMRRPLRDRRPTPRTPLRARSPRLRIPGDAGRHTSRYPPHRRSGRP